MARRNAQTGSTQLTGAAGEYYVAAELSRRGWAATVTPKGVPRTVLGHNLDSGELVAVQVKTASGRSWFRLSERHESSEASEPEWFVLVKILADENSRPDFYLVPTSAIAACVYLSYRVQMARPGRDGRPRKPTDIRMVNPDHVARYRDRWDLLRRPTRQVPPLLSDSLFEEAATESVQLPENHPYRHSRAPYVVITDFDGAEHGTVELDESGHAVATTEAVRRLLAYTKVFVPNEPGREVRPDDGIEYLRALPAQFRGHRTFARLHASEEV